MGIICTSLMLPDRKSRIRPGSWRRPWRRVEIAEPGWPSRPRSTAAQWVAVEGSRLLTGKPRYCT